jgi:N4-(beta-N-acetylglucosaminyl)-L-asparaginase
MSTRRTFIEAVAGVSALATTGASRATERSARQPQAAAGTASRSFTRYMVVSTWDFGAAANAAAYAKLSSGGSLLDAVEEGARVPEADPDNHSVGLGGYPDRDGHVTLDAIIMDDRGNLGAVAALEDVVHAVSVARKVMEKTPHTLLVGQGATQFALEQGFKRERLLTPQSEAAWREWLKQSKYQPQANIENRNQYLQPGSAGNHDTIGILACDTAGRLAGACTTSGMAFKLRGRVGDSPQCGAGLYVEPGVGGATSTGVGEEVTRIVGTSRVVASMRAGMSPAEACHEAVQHLMKLRGDALKGEQVGFLALSNAGEVGAFALMPGFTYAVTDTAGKTTVLPAEHM